MSKKKKECNVSKKELAIRVSRELKDSRATQQICLQIIQQSLEDIMDFLKEGRTIEFRNFGVFEVRERKARTGRNPKRPSETVAIPAHRVVAFRQGKEMRKLWD